MANAELTISMLKGEAGNQRELLHEFVQWIKSTYQPDVIHVTNALLIGVVREFKRAFQVPVTCGLHGEDIFLEGMPQVYQDEALSIIRERATDVDRFLAISTYYGENHRLEMTVDGNNLIFETNENDNNKNRKCTRFPPTADCARPLSANSILVHWFNRAQHRSPPPAAAPASPD